MNEQKYAVINHATDSILDCEGLEGSELHNRLFNEDYFIIGTYQAKQFLGSKTFDAIEKVKEYEQDNFGEVFTDFSEPEKVVNMLAYIIGEEVLGECPTLQSNWDECLCLEQLAEIKLELEEL